MTSTVIKVALETRSNCR